MSRRQSKNTQSTGSVGDQKTPVAILGPTRNPVRRSNREHHVGKFYSFKGDKMLVFESRLEADFLTVVLPNPIVSDVIPQPTPIQWYDGQFWREYTPDFAVFTTRGIVDTEVKSLTALGDDKLLKELSQIARAAKKAGRNFKVYHERLIRIEPRLTNSRIILSQAGDDVATPDDISAIRQIAAGTQIFTIDDLVCNDVLPYGRAYRTVLNLVACGELEIDLSTRICGSSHVWRRSSHG